VTVDPSWLGGEHDGRTFGARCLGGSLVAGPDGMLFDHLACSIDRGTLRVDGRLGPTERSLLAGELRVDALVAGTSDDLRALLPGGARTALERIDLGTDSAIWTDAMRVLLDAPREGATRVSVIGDVGIADAHFRGGIDFDRIDGFLAFDLSSEGGVPAGSIGLRLDQARAMSRRATDVAGTLIFEPESGRIRLEQAEGSMYGGRVAATGSYDPQLGWEVHVSAANVGFARIIAAGAAPAPVPGGEEGRLRGRIDVRGRLDDQTLRRGSGKIAVEGARMMEFPLGMSFLQLTQLMLPLNASMDRAFVAFDIDDQRINLRQIDLSSGTLRFEGAGEVSTDTGALALRFHSRGQLPLLSDLYGVVSDQFFAIDVGGTLSDPQPRLTPIPVLAPAPNAAPKATTGPTTGSPTGATSTEQQ
jgi:hypothetical protein